MVYSFFSGLETQMEILASGPVGVFLPVSIVFALYALVRAHQARRFLIAARWQETSMVP
jgi:hypothetical protein